MPVRLYLGKPSDHKKVAALREVADEALFLASNGAELFVQNLVGGEGWGMI
ncbi:hypothetical protein [Peribacillus simplex]|uniref:hypothetical protein n=1 Tax=Peribacillus simplex TaxID=1478 RepID=UPI00162A77F5|nr:hypothetical protein [Peribacillus simplex]